MKVDLKKQEVKSFLAGTKFQLDIKVSLDADEQQIARKHPRIYVIEPDEISQAFEPGLALKLLKPYPFMPAFERGFSFKFPELGAMTKYETLFRRGVERWKQQVQNIASATSSLGSSESFEV